MITTNELYWLAGLLEGEGCFSNNGSAMIQCSMVDKDVVERAAALMGAKVIETAPQREGYKPQFRLYICGRNAASWMMTVYSLMGERRKAKIRECLLKWSGQRVVNADRPTCLYGHNDWRYGQANGLKRRWCRECKRIDARKSYAKHREKSLLEGRLQNQLSQ